MLVHILVLNYNGRDLLGACLPSVVDAARESHFECQVIVVDNSSTDDSVAWVRERFPSTVVLHCANRGLCSFNDVVPQLPGPVAVLLNNDIKLAAASIDPLVEPLLQPHRDDKCYMTAPLCWLFDGETYEGLKTSVRWRWGLVQATARYPGYQRSLDRPGLTASAGAAMAVRCDVFTALGGFDPLYLPGRLEDLDFCYRAWMAGYHARYVPASVMYHYGMATFGPAFGTEGCDHLALRNTLLFQWKNLRHPLYAHRRALGILARIVLDTIRAPWTEPTQRWRFLRAFCAAMAHRHRARASGYQAADNPARQREFFRQFHPHQMRKQGPGSRVRGSQLRRKMPTSRVARGRAPWTQSACAKNARVLIENTVV
jgi:GT2 family glycosyltransferase